MSAYTMSTIDPAVGGVPAPAPAPGAGEAQQTGESLSAAMVALLNPTVIAQMANEFFSALPGSAAPPAAAEPAVPLGPYEFRPEVVPGLLLATPPVSPPSAPSISAVASAPPATPPVELGTLPVTPAAPSTSALASPTEAELRSLPATLSGATGSSLPAAVTVPTAASSGSSYYFLEGVQSMPYTAPAFPLEPYGFDPAMLPDLGLAAGPYDPRISRRDFPNL